ncbi:MAG: outer membrane protein assembly factor BamD, partial [Planctomycetota bacterium]
MIPKWTLCLLCAALLLAAVAVGGCDEPAIPDEGEAGDATSLRLEEEGWEVEDAAATGAAGDLTRIRGLMEQGEYVAVVRAVKKHVRTYRGELSNEEALHLAGQAQLARGEYYKAYEWFEKQIAQYPGGTLLERGLLGEVEAGEALMGGEKRWVWGMFPVSAKGEGRMILERVVEHAPGTQLAEKVLLRLADWRYDRGDYVEAVERYDVFVRQFPRGAHTGYAILRGAQASGLLYRGSEFDEGPLIEAEQRYAIVLEQFPDLARQEQVAEAVAEIREQRAAKSYEAGRFYERTDQFDTAVYYYRKTIELFPETQQAVLAQSWLRQWGLDDTEAPPEPERPARRPVARVERREPPVVPRREEPTEPAPRPP